LLPVAVLVVPVVPVEPVVPVPPAVPGGVAGTGIKGPAPVVPGGSAPSRLNPARVATKPYEPTMSPFPEHVRACSVGASDAAHKSTTAMAVRSVPCLIDSIDLLFLYLCVANGLPVATRLR